MGKITGFLEIERHDRTYKPVSDRTRHFKEFVIPLDEEEVVHQAARCMDCGVPYCHKGCPVNNQIPDWNDLVYHEDWEAACINLHSTNNFPEFTGRVCPAPCEESCTLNIEDIPVTIKTVECAIVDKGWEQGWLKPLVAPEKTGKKVAIIGGGPAGMAAAQQLARAGHDVHLYEKNAKVGGLLRYGIPDFKMDKKLIDRRVEQMEVEGVEFHYNSHIGQNVAIADIEKDHDAVLLTGGSEQPRDLPVKGRDLDGVHFAMDFLTQQNRRVSKEDLGDVKRITAKSKNVVVIGGGDTGSDCIGTSIRQDALSVTQIEIMPEPPEKEDKAMIWPEWPVKMRTSSSQAEGAKRMFSLMTQEFFGEDGKVTDVAVVEVDDQFRPIPGTETTLKAELVLLAMGFVNPVHEGMIEDLQLSLTDRGNIEANEQDYKTSREKVFAAGDMRRGQSLVVWAIREGRQAAHAIDSFLMGSSLLPR